jgi:hypothetical protein
LPNEPLCDLPSGAFLRFSSLYPGRFAQGPEEKFGMTGFFSGFIYPSNKETNSVILS